MYRKVLLYSLISVFLMLIGCNKSVEEGPYAGILMVDGEEYTWQGEIENNEFTVGEKIGEVNKKVEIEGTPKTNYSSNILEVGEGIFLAVESNKVIIVKREGGSYHQFKEDG
ncbi:hypothetical protein LF817_13290 [Halobacillus sp. A1]|uniref:hypothetical protein n=1 Tax=Halobacillus sp. A1 TaxID=2880262 RepID=UPI0020A6B431|nr:hypothetical protein [Halobacillus sp. A1]MCP3032316.1 hypothetical protein [Halobacillus sp. A1]